MGLFGSCFFQECAKTKQHGPKLMSHVAPYQMVHVVRGIQTIQGLAKARVQHLSSAVLSGDIFGDLSEHLGKKIWFIVTCTYDFMAINGGVYTKSSRTHFLKI